MKAVIVIDMPDGCDECQFCGFGGRNLERYVCCLTGEHSEDIHLVGCPLKPLPHKLQADWYTDGYKEGFNACLEEITGETE